jgi:type III restriction enzyme
MRFRFDATQEHQIKAIESVLRLFEGQEKIETAMHYIAEGGFLGSPNKLNIGDDDLLRNLNDVQDSSNISKSPSLECISQEVDTAAGRRKVKFANFSVEMETGTGKTYVYIRTALELNKRYGFRRFIIVVPSIAVKEGVLKTFQMTREHFKELYGNMPYKYYAYDSANLTQIRQFSMSSNVEFMVMTLDSFNKAMTEQGKGNVIRRPTDRLQGATPICIIQASRPILILDEPQNMESEKSIAALAALNPLLALRYSATHRNPYNLVYRLTPADAYHQGLVKKIEVASVIKEDDVNQVFIRLNGIAAIKRKITASLTVNKLMRTGVVKEASITVKPGDNLKEKTNMPEYESFSVDEINPGSKSVLFGNGIEIQIGESRGADKEAIFKAQIQYTIEEHFRKQKRLSNRGIKVLSLFFIDRVENYVSKTGLIRQSFVEAFEELKQKYPDWKNLSPDEVQASYFAFDRKKSGQIIYEDSSSGESQKDEKTYDLIMRDKERLLSFGTKVAFIFSHSALREGWDNPNIFQVCTLNQTASEIKKRQEVGRGVRLAVDQNGERAHDPQVNILTVVANQSYDQYVRELQEEIVEEYGREVELPPKPANARKRTSIKLRKEFMLKPEFKDLWDRIKSKTRYFVTINTNELVEETVKAINGIEIKPPRVIITKAQLDIDKEGAFEAIQLSSAKTFVDLAGRYPLPNLVEAIVYLLENTTPPVRLTKKTLVDIFLKTQNKKAALDNPFGYASAVARVLKEKLADHLVNGIQYEKINGWYEMSRLEEPFETWEDYTIPATRSLYDRIEYDSEVERKFVEGLERIDQVRMYIKLPSWFTVPTPIGDYNPDWAIVWEERDEHGQPTGKPLLYLVRETKSTTQRDKLRPDERHKIICGERHFAEALGVSYKVVTSPFELP